MQNHQNDNFLALRPFPSHFTAHALPNTALAQPYHYPCLPTSRYLLAVYWTLLFLLPICKDVVTSSLLWDYHKLYPKYNFPGFICFHTMLAPIFYVYFWMFPRISIIGCVCWLVGRVTHS